MAPIATRPALAPRSRSPQHLHRRLYARVAAPKRPHKPLLLNQRFLRGLGNIYVDESLFRARIHPLAIAPRLSRQRSLAFTRRSAPLCDWRSSIAGRRFPTTWMRPASAAHFNCCTRCMGKRAVLVRFAASPFARSPSRSAGPIIVRAASARKCDGALRRPLLTSSTEVRICLLLIAHTEPRHRAVIP